MTRAELRVSIRRAIDRAYQDCPAEPYAYVLGWICEEAGFSREQQLELVALIEAVPRPVDLTPRTQV